MKKTILLIMAMLACLPPLQAKKKQTVQTDREYWCAQAYRMAQPVLEPMSRGELQKTMKTEFSPSFDNRDRSVVYMETFGRLMAGIAPWLTTTPAEAEEYEQVRQLREWALQSYKNAVDPQSPDYLCWGRAGQNLVDAAYIAESFLRGYDSLWMPLDDVTKQRYIKEFQALRRIDPPYTNWLLFSSVIEGFIAKAVATSQISNLKSSTMNTASTRPAARWRSGTSATAGMPTAPCSLSTTIRAMSSTPCIWRPSRRWSMPR